ncbi:thioredoxin-dependent thiol peroxidase [Gayadomonas joobiniege]|uniref:thioredoxin-dependent thiol peroxidase n=1 Tax=Gayadomonas joobiniege TaxID=1234606 RepID=UPI0003715B72|nr:thioredoxin-dependent thiol peroxidase [Gayadomonas joobiniege]
MNTLKAGDKAPKFELLDQNGETVALSEVLKSHKALVYFYPKAMTPGCTTQACNLRDSDKKLAELNVKVLGMSPDQPDKLKKFEQKHELNFTLLSDPEHKIAEAFGVWGLKKFMGKEYDGIHRISFLVEQDGTISHVFDKFKTKDHHDVVIAHLENN